MDDVSRIHIPETMIAFAENLDKVEIMMIMMMMIMIMIMIMIMMIKVVIESPVRGESVLDRCREYFELDPIKELSTLFVKLTAIFGSIRFLLSY